MHLFNTRVWWFKDERMHVSFFELFIAILFLSYFILWLLVEEESRIYCQNLVDVIMPVSGSAVQELPTRI